ncbi:MAG: aldo/keto reductase [Cyclobacteriaceae bacterium]
MQTNRIILGTVQFGLDYGINNKGGKTGAEETFRILNYALDNGITTLDSAFAYGTALKIIGQFHERFGRFFQVNSKFKVEQGDSVEKQLVRTFSNLGLKGIDTFFYHKFDDLQNTRIQHELKSFKSRGLIKKIGISIYTNREFEEAMNYEWIDVIQIPFNVLDNNNRRGDLIRLAKAKKKEIQVRSVFLQGLLFMRPNALPQRLKPLGRYLDVLNSISGEENLSIEEIALQYVMENPLIDNVLIGVDTLDQLESNVKKLKSPRSKKLSGSVDGINVAEVDLLNPQNWS